MRDGARGDLAGSRPGKLAYAPAKEDGLGEQHHEYRPVSGDAAGPAEREARRRNGRRG